MNSFDQDIADKKRFGFGKNWLSFSENIGEHQINEAVGSLRNMLDKPSLEGKTFLDIGSGSGLFSLAARQLGARVSSFDYDPDSVACTRRTKNRYRLDDTAWTIQRGSVLDRPFLETLGTFDIVYSWGVLHHTGEMWSAIDNASQRVNPGGLFFIALYNDQGALSRTWLKIKRVYCSGGPGRALVTAAFLPSFFLRACAASIVRKTNVFRTYYKNRGMSIVHDWVDWLGGLPFEVASTEAVTNFLTPRGFTLVKCKRTSSFGNNEFVFKKSRAG